MALTTSTQLAKGEFYTIEAFHFEVEDGCYYEEERFEPIDTFWYAGLGLTLEEKLDQECKDNLTEDDLVRVSLIPRRWATIVDGEPEEYGDDCLGREDYIWNGKELLSEEDYLQYC